MKEYKKLKPFINKYNWDAINFPSEKDDWTKFEKNNATILLNVLYAKKKKDILLMVQYRTQILKKSDSINDYKWKDGIILQ